MISSWTKSIEEQFLIWSVVCAYSVIWYTVRNIGYIGIAMMCSVPIHHVDKTFAWGPCHDLLKDVPLEKWKA